MREGGGKKGQCMCSGYSPPEHATGQLQVGRELYLVASGVAMADKRDNGGSKDKGKEPDQPEEERETAALMRQLLASIERQQGKPGNSSQGKPQS